MPIVAIIADQSFMARASVIQRILQNFGVPSARLKLQEIPEGVAGKSALNAYDAAIFLQHETNQNNSGNKRFYTWVAYAPGDKPLAHFGCVNRLAGSSSADYNSTLGALSPVFPIIRYNSADANTWYSFPNTSGIETDGYRARFAGTRLVFPNGCNLWTRTLTVRTGSAYGLFKVNPAHLDENRQVVLRAEIEGQSVPSDAAAGVRYYNRYFLPATGTASNEAICRAIRDSSYDWQQTLSLPLILWFLEQVGIYPDAFPDSLFRQPVSLEHDHPIDDNTAQFPGTLADQRIRRRKTEYETYQWLVDWSKRTEMPIQLGINTGGKTRPRTVSNDAKTHWQAIFEINEHNPSEARRYASLTNEMIAQNTSCFKPNAHDHTRELGFLYATYPRHEGGTYGLGNALPGTRTLLAASASDPNVCARLYSMFIAATGGTFRLSFAGSEQTTPLNYNLNSSTLQSALESLSTVGMGTVFVWAQGSGQFMIAFGTPMVRGELLLYPSGLTGGSATLIPSLSIDNEPLLNLHLENNLLEMQSLGFETLHGGTRHLNNARNAKGGPVGPKGFYQWGVRSLRIADSSSDSDRFRQTDWGSDYRLLRQDGVELIPTPASSLDVGNKGLLTPGGTGGNDSNANTTWSLGVTPADPNAPTFQELQLARNRLMSIVTDRILFAWLIYGGIPYLHGSNAHAADPDHPLEDFALNGNWNAMKEIHQAVEEALILFQRWFRPGTAVDICVWRNRLRDWLSSHS